MSAPSEDRIYFGDLVRAKGYATTAQILECLQTQQQEDAGGKPHRRLGEILVDRGYMTPEQLEELLALL